MADITMCKGVEGVELCDICYRKNATPNEHYQSYFANQPIQHADGKNPICTWYWKKEPLQGSWI